MHPFALLIAALLAGGPLPPPAATAQELRLVLDERAGRRLELVRTASPETTPPLEGRLDLVEAGARRTLADAVGAAVLLPGGRVLAVRRGELVELAGGRAAPLSRGLAPELAVDPSGTRLALVRPRSGGGSDIEILELGAAGKGAPRTVVSGPGTNNAPTFAPDGRTLLFVSTRTGLSSLFRVGLDGKGERQLTNRGLTAVGPLFVPPPSRTAPPRFVAGRLVFDAGPERWSVDPASGAAVKVEGGRR